MSPRTKNVCELFMWISVTVGYWALIYASPTYYPLASPEVIFGFIWTVLAVHRIKQCWAKV